MTWWLNEGQSHSPEQIAGWLSQLNQATLEQVIGKTSAAERIET